MSTYIPTPPPVQFPRPDFQLPSVNTKAVRTGRVARRQHRRHPSPLSVVGHLVKVILGGAAGCVLGCLVVWWCFGKDPAGVAPAVGELFPEAVPAHLRKE